MNLSSCTELLHYLPSAEDAKDFYSSLLANCVLNAFMAVLTVILNCTAIHAVRKASYLSTSLRTLLLNLAISDLGIAGVGLFVTSILYFKIYQVRRRHNIQIQQIQPHQELCQSNDAASAEETMTFAKKYAVGVFYVYAVFLLCYLPHAFSLLALA
ncbi:hypothetical protein P5673_009702, partial [Acropora cervicornis]